MTTTTRFGAHAALLVSFFALGCAAQVPDGPGCAGKCDGSGEDEEFEYIVVGAGAGGGTLASRLAELGHSVLLVEAGDFAPAAELREVPAMHAQASEHPDLSWSYHVEHYTDPAMATADSKYEMSDDPQRRGVFYPRGATVGGSTAVNAMIAVYPHEQDWANIALRTGDETWLGWRMREYFTRIEDNRYVDPGTEGHGFEGWLPISHPSTTLALRDLKLVSLVKGATRVSGSNFVEDATQLFGLAGRDINSADAARDLTEGAFNIPTSTEDGVRVGVRDRILDTMEAGHPLTLYTRSLATRVLFDEESSEGAPRAIGVEILRGAHLYRADRRAAEATEPTRREVFASREVILAAGAFNTPQLLMLSGIGPADELSAHGIEPRVISEGVGRNLQDRYELPVVVRSERPFDALDDCAFDTGVEDDCLLDWQDGGGWYTTNGGVVGMVRRSGSALSLDPDLFIFGVPGSFRGYYGGYSDDLTEDPNLFTWLVLKAHSANEGRVRLRSADPRDTPLINFQYFGDPEWGEEPSGDHQRDLEAVVEAVHVIRDVIAESNDASLINDYEEVWPGTEVDSFEEIADYAMAESWGHHASCTAAIGGDDDEMAVLDSRLRVRGTEGLRVADASVFPEIPGFFPVVAVMMVGERAAEMIHQDALQ